MPNFLKRFDSSGREPRQVQIDALEWLDEHWDSRVLCLSLPVGAGKSAISKAVADTTGAHVVTPSNILIDQYTKTYPAHNALKGRAHYSCHGVAGFSCQEWVDISGEKACARCPYTESRERAHKEPTFFNPLSLYYMGMDQRWNPPTTLIVDEAHTLPGMILQMCGAKLRQSEYRFGPGHVNEVELVPWLELQVRRLGELKKLYAKDYKKLRLVANEYVNLNYTLSGLRENAQNYAIWINRGTHYGRPETFLNIRPISPPQQTTRRIIGARRLVLMSGTLFSQDIQDLVGDIPYKLLDAPSPIPVDRRLIYYDPMPFPLNKDTPGDRIVHEIESTIKKYGGGYNTLVHVAYSLSKKIVPQFRMPVLANVQADKDAVLEQFKRQGGVFIAAGCAEGVDLPGDLCRLNVIPKLPFPDMSDPTVSKRKAAAGGEEWFAMQTFKTLIQQCGRSTRGADDWSVTIIRDPNFPRLYRRFSQYLPNSFKEAIRWHAPSQSGFLAS